MEGRLAPVQTLYRILVKYGHCKDNKAAFGSLLRISGSNVYAYLRDADDPRRINVRPETLHAWCWAIRQVTSLEIVVRLDFLGELSLEVGGCDDSGAEIERKVYLTNYADFSVTKPWEFTD